MNKIQSSHIVILFKTQLYIRILSEASVKLNYWTLDGKSPPPGKRFKSFSKLISCSQMENKSNQVYFILWMNGKMSLAYSKRKEKSPGSRYPVCATAAKKAILSEEMGCSEPENRSESHLHKSQACFHGNSRRRKYLFTIETPRVSLGFFFFHLKRKRWFIILRRNLHELLKFHLWADFQGSVKVRRFLLCHM